MLMSRPVYVYIYIYGTQKMIYIRKHDIYANKWTGLRGAHAGSCPQAAMIKGLLEI
jgi:hypothetical protein